MNLLKYDYEDLIHVHGWVSPKQCMVELFGGVQHLADAVGLHRTSIYGWRDGIIPHRHQYRLLQLYEAQIPYTDFVQQLIMGKIK